MLANKFCEKYNFSLDDLELLTFYGLLERTDNRVSRSGWRFNKVSEEELKLIRSGLEYIKNKILANDILKEWSPKLTNQQQKKEKRFADDLITIMNTAQ